MLSCDLIALPDVLLLSCVDKSLRTCVMLAGTSKAIRAKPDLIDSLSLIHI